MTNNKISFLLALSIGAILYPITSFSSNRTEAQANNYADNFFATVFHPSQNEPKGRAQINKMKQAFAQHLKNSKEFKWKKSWWSREKVYENEYVIQLIYAVIIDEVRANIESRCGKAVANSKIDKITQKISNSSELPVGCLSNYIGEAVEKELNGQQYTYSAPAGGGSSASPFKKFYEEECRVCSNPTNEVPMVHLSPCGHDFCSECATKIFLNQTRPYKTNPDICSVCSTTINKDYLRASLRNARPHPKAWARAA